MNRQHSHRIGWIVLGVIASGLSPLRPAEGAQVSGLVIFGDSLSDVGNFYAATNGAGPATSLGYAAGRFTDGPNWVEYLARDLGVASPTASLNGGLDYAYGGAMTGPGTTLGSAWGANYGDVTATVPNMDTQVADYLGSHTPSADQLFVLWGGANDILHAAPGTTPDPYQIVGNLANEIATLAGHGATQFLVGDLPLLGELPFIKQFDPADSQLLDGATMLFNALLQAELSTLQGQPGIQVHLLDVNSLYQDAVANPSKYGFTDVTGDPLFDPGAGSPVYLSFDGIHPTTQADQFIGALGAQAATPEPTSLVLLATAVAAGAVWLRRR